MVAAVLVALALSARLATWSWRFGGGHVELVPSDSHYYVRLARLQLAARRPVAFDPFVGFPAGSENYWPPLHALLVTLAVGLAPDPEAGAAFVGPVASLLWVVAIAAVAYRAVGPRRALFALFVLALTPMAVESGMIGNADHNVHETFLAALVTLLAVAAVRGSLTAAVGAGVVAGAARLFTTTGFVLPGVLALAWGTAAALSKERAGLTRRAALSGACCVGVLGLAVMTLGYPARFDFEALTLFHPLLAVALFGLAVGASAYFDGLPRAAAGFSALGLAVLPILPALVRAAGQMARNDPLLAVVRESQPLLTDPGLALLLFGPVLVALPFALAGAVRVLRTRAVPEAAVPVVATAIFVVGAAAQSRLGLFLIGASAVLLPLGLGSAISLLRPPGARWAYGVIAVGFAPLLLMLVPPPVPRQPPQAAMIRPTLVWMRDHLPPAASDPWDDGAKPSYGVLAPFDYGHYITLYAERPVLASPFSQTDVHVEANRVGSEILSDTDEEHAYRRIRELRLDYVLAAPSTLFGRAAPAPDALLSRLIRREPLGRFEPLYVSTELRPGGGRYATVFEVVDGAVLTGTAGPGAEVDAALSDGYARSARADSAGVFRIRVARPGMYSVSSSTLAAMADVTQDQVRAGSIVAIGRGR